MVCACMHATTTVTVRSGVETGEQDVVAGPREDDDDDDESQACLTSLKKAIGKSCHSKE